MLGVSANPGCGKSVLSKYLVDSNLGRPASHPVCYFFFKDDSEDQRSTEKALCSLLHQILQHRRILLQHAINKYRIDGTSLPTLFESLWSIFTAIVTHSEAKDIICVIDALDECKKSGRVALVHKLNELYHTTELDDNPQLFVRFLVTSRGYQDIQNDFHRLTIRLPGEEESHLISQEIDLVIKWKIQGIASTLGIDKAEQQFLEEKLSNFPHRTYLWVTLVMEVIRGRQCPLRAGITKRRLQAVVDDLPETVEGAYSAILDKSTDKELARKLLHCVVIAKRPLTVEEMNIVLAIQESEKSEGDIDIELMKRFRNTVRNLCGLFISIEKERIYLIHQTAREFLICNRDTVGPVMSS